MIFSLLPLHKKRPYCQDVYCYCLCFQLFHLILVFLLMLNYIYSPFEYLLALLGLNVYQTMQLITRLFTFWPEQKKSIDIHCSIRHQLLNCMKQDVYQAQSNGGKDLYRGFIGRPLCQTTDNSHHFLFYNVLVKTKTVLRRPIFEQADILFVVTNTAEIRLTWMGDLSWTIAWDIWLHVNVR